MYAKLAIRNIKRSFKDYTIYFFTLVFGVAIFYTFNSIESQTVMMDLSEAEKNAFSMVTIVMSIASVFISFILGFLIIYANNYLIKRRKKEFGIYMTLGMEKEKLSKILFIETLCIGVISLLVGTIIGIMVSQGLSIFTAKLFKVDITKFIFIFSKDAFLKTLICFSIIYFVVLLFNSNIIRRVKLVDLLTASKKNENIKSRNVWINIMIFTISVILLGTAYYFVLKVGIAIVSPILFGIVAIGALGTFLFFFSLSGFLLKVFKSNKTYYFKGLNMFVLKQISSKINTNFISMTFICLMLFISICTLSGGLGINKALNKDVKELFQFDASLWNYEGIDIKENVLNRGVDLDSILKNYSEYKLNYSEYAFGDFLSGKAMKENKNYNPIMTNANKPIVKVSEINSIMKMLGKDEVTIKDNEYMLYSDIDDIEKYLVESLENNTEILINGHKLLPADKKTIEVVT